MFSYCSKSFPSRWGLCNESWNKSRWKLIMKYCFLKSIPFCYCHFVYVFSSKGGHQYKESLCKSLSSPWSHQMLWIKSQKENTIPKIWGEIHIPGKELHLLKPTIIVKVGRNCRMMNAGCVCSWLIEVVYW